MPAVRIELAFQANHNKAWRTQSPLGGEQDNPSGLTVECSVHDKASVGHRPVRRHVPEPEQRRQFSVRLHADTELKRRLSLDTRIGACPLARCISGRLAECFAAQANQDKQPRKATTVHDVSHARKPDKAFKLRPARPNTICHPLYRQGGKISERSRVYRVILRFRNYPQAPRRRQASDPMIHPRYSG